MPPLLIRTLKVLMRYPIVILMLGDWRTGKTDTSLLLAHLAKKWGLIDKIGSNIWTFNNPEVDYIISMPALNKWLHEDKQRKLFLFDEGLKHMYRRKAMSSKNVDFITEVLPELSKGHARVVIISQIEKVDSDIIHPAFCRAVWRKLNKKTMLCLSKHHPPRTFRNLPKSPIGFDPDRSALFTSIDMSKKPTSGVTGRTYEIARLYVKEIPMSQIALDLTMHRQEVKRHIQKALKWYLEHYEETTEEKKEEIVNKPKLAPFP